MLFNYESNKHKLSTKVQNKVSKNGITFQYSSFCRGDSSFCTSHFFLPHPTYLGHKTITMKHVSHSETLPYTKCTEKKHPFSQTQLCYILGLHPADLMAITRICWFLLPQDS